MYILTILLAIWFLNRSSKLRQTKNIEKYVWGNPKKLKIKMDMQISILKYILFKVYF